MDIGNGLESCVVEVTHPPFARSLLDHRVRRPMFQPQHLDFGPRAPTRPAVGTLIGQLRAAGMIKESRRGSGRHVMAYALA